MSIVIHPTFLDVINRIDNNHRKNPNWIKITITIKSRKQYTSIAEIERYLEMQRDIVFTCRRYRRKGYFVIYNNTL